MANVAVLMLHAGCNMVCDFCITEDSLGTKSFADAVKLIHEFRDQGVRSLVIGGGEPFTWPHDLMRLTEEAKKLGFLVQVGTNGIHLPDGFATITSIDRYVIPLESVAPDPHNRLRKFRRAHHELIMERLRRLAEAKKSVTLSTVVTRINHEHVLEVGEFLRAYQEQNGNVHAWHIYRFVPEGRGGRENAHALSVPLDRYEEVFAQVRARHLPFKVFKRANMFQSKTVNFY